MLRIHRLLAALLLIAAPATLGAGCGGDGISVPGAGGGMGGGRDDGGMGGGAGGGDGDAGDLPVDLDGGIPDDMNPDAGPPLEAIVYSDADQMGHALALTAGHYLNLYYIGDGSLMDSASSVVVPEGLVVYGFEGIGYIGRLTNAIVGPATVNLTGDDNDLWESVIVRPASEPFITVYGDVPLGSPKQYPIGRFAYIGDMDDRIDGLDIPDELVVEPYDRGDFRGRAYGPYVGGQLIEQVPDRDVYSSLVVRLRAAGEVTNVPFRFYDDNPFQGDVLALMPGRYPDLNQLDRVAGQLDWNDDIDSFEGPSEYRIWGFDQTNYREGVSGPYQAPIATLGGWNNKFASLIIEPATEPTVAIFLDAPGDGVIPLTYPIVDVAKMGDSNKNDAVDVPPGYVIYGYVNDDYGGRGERYVNAGTSVMRFFPGEVEGDSMHDDWDSFQIRAVDDPTVTLYFADALGNPQVYPIGSFPDLEDNRTNTLKGASVPCGVTVEAWTCDGYSSCGESPGHWTIVGPFDSADVGADLGKDDWDSMRVYRNGDLCD
jgi:hypothetical protein